MAIKLEVIKGNHSNLTVGNSCTFKIQEESSTFDLDSFKKQLIKNILKLK